MRRLVTLLSIVAVALLGVLAVQRQPVAIAQEGTPAAGAMEFGPFEPLGFAQGVMLPSPADLLVARFRLEPGDGFPLQAADPTGGMVFVESGAITFRVEEMAWTITRGAALSEAMASADMESEMTGVMEEVAMGQEATLEAGDVAWVPGSVSGEVRNDGNERAEAIVFLVGPPEAMAGATPTP